MLHQSGHGGGREQRREKIPPEGRKADRKSSSPNCAAHLLSNILARNKCKSTHSFFPKKKQIRSNQSHREGATLKCAVTASSLSATNRQLRQLFRTRHGRAVVEFSTPQFRPHRLRRRNRPMRWWRVRINSFCFFLPNFLNQSERPLKSATQRRCTDASK